MAGNTDAMKCPLSDLGDGLGRAAGERPKGRARSGVASRQRLPISPIGPIGPIII